MGAATLPINLVEPLQDLDLALVEGLLLALKLVLEALDSIIFTRLNVSTLVDVAETAATNQFFLLELVPQDGLSFWRRRQRR